jgi:hypothetical protein
LEKRKSSKENEIGEKMTIRKGMGKGMGSGYKNILMAHDKRVHRDAGLGRKQPQRIPQMIGGKLPNKININKHNWSFEKDGKKIELTLGNMTDAGWFWNGNEKDLVSYLIRLNPSQTNNEFLQEMKKNNILFNDFKTQMIKNLDKSDGLYEISGDNVRWKFGQTFTSDSSDGISNVLDYEEEHGIKLTEEQKQKFMNEIDYNDGSTDFDEFEREAKGQYKEKMSKAIKQSNSFSDFFDELEKIKEDYQEIMLERDSQLESESITEQFNNFVKKEGITK